MIRELLFIAHTKLEEKARELRVVLSGDPRPPAQRILEDSFAALVTFIEDERAFDRGEWASTHTRQRARSIIEDLYEWWTVRRPRATNVSRATHDSIDLIQLKRLMDVRQHLTLTREA